MVGVGVERPIARTESVIALTAAGWAAARGIGRLGGRRGRTGERKGCTAFPVADLRSARDWKVFSEARRRGRSSVKYECEYHSCIWLPVKGPVVSFALSSHFRYTHPALVLQGHGKTTRWRRDPLSPAKEGYGQATRRSRLAHPSRAAAWRKESRRQSPRRFHRRWECQVVEACISGLSFDYAHLFIPGGEAGGNPPLLLSSTPSRSASATKDLGFLPLRLLLPRALGTAASTAPPETTRSC